jgi:hypothetical protein
MATSSDDDSKYKPDLIKVYEQLCQSYRAIDDFRAKLLGFLPLVSGGGIFVLLSNSSLQDYMGAIGAFGAVITLGLLVYEIYGIEKCTALIKAGQDLESSFPLDGQFLSRPTGLLQRTGFLSHINEPFAAGIIYPAVLAAWTYLALILTWPVAAPILSILVFIVGFSMIYRYTSSLLAVYELRNR